MRKNEERFKNPAKPANGAIGDREHAEAAVEAALGHCRVLADTYLPSLLEHFRK